MSLKNHILTNIVNLEGGYVDNPNDSGGPTKYGVTEATAKRYGYDGDMVDMPVSFAFDVYADVYWHSVKADELTALSRAIAAEVVDTAVNAGPATSARFLQRSLNVLNSRGTLYPDLTVDGLIGPATIKTLSGYLQKRDEVVLLKMLNALQGAYYVELAERREKDETFIYGWFNHRVN